MRAKKSVLRQLRKLSLPEIAVLELTNDPKVKSKSSSVMVTAKDVYVWAALMAHVAEKHPEITPEQLLHAATAAPAIRKTIKRFYKGLPVTAPNSTESYVDPPDGVSSAIATLRLTIKFDELAQSAKTAYTALARKGWIEDPVEILAAGVAFAVMGLVPVSFTQKTKEGRRISRKVKALYWGYEKSESRGVTTTKVEFRLLKMLKAFKAGIVGGFKNAMEDEGDENA